jgi:hypothetical protein
MFKSNWKIYFALTVIIILLVSGKGLLAQAATIEKIEIDSNKKIKITGACNGGVLNTQIFSATSSQPFYTAGANCHENKFEFEDNLGYWKIPDGDYSIAVIDKDDNLVNSSAATFTIQSVVPLASDASIIEPAIDLENNPSVISENDTANIEITNQGEASDGLFAQIINFLVEWFKSAIVMIKELVVEKVTTPELCLGNTCIIEDQLKGLLGGPLIPSSISDATTTN